MKTFDTISAARDAISDYPIASVPAHMRERFRSLRSSPSSVDQIVGLGEFLYANRAQFDDDAIELAGGLIAYATVNAWHGLQDKSRGDRIVQAIRRDLSEVAPAGSSFPEANDDPEPREQYVMPAPSDDKLDA